MHFYACLFLFFYFLFHCFVLFFFICFVCSCLSLRYYFNYVSFLLYHTSLSFILYFCFVFPWFYSLSHLSFHYFSSSPLFFRFLFLIIIPSLLSILSMLVSDSNFVQFSRFSAVLRYCCSFPAFLCPSPFADFPRLFANSTSHFPKVNK